MQNVKQRILDAFAAHPELAPIKNAFVVEEVDCKTGVCALTALLIHEKGVTLSDIKARTWGLTNDGIPFFGWVQQTLGITPEERQYVCGGWDDSSGLLDHPEYVEASEAAKSLNPRDEAEPDDDDDDFLDDGVNYDEEYDDDFDGTENDFFL